MGTTVSAIGSGSGGTGRYGAVGAALVLALGLALLPQVSSASTVTVSGGGLDAGALCSIGALCPTNPVAGYGYSSGGAVTGTLDYNSVTDTANFSFTLTANTYFGTEELAAGSTFSASAIPVTVTTNSGIQTVSLGSPPVDASTSNVQFISPTLTMIENNLSLSALSCTISAVAGQCGVSVGSVNGAGNALEFVDAQNNDYNAYLTFNVNVIPVPLPPALPMLLSAIAGLGFIARGRRVSLI